MKNAVIRITSIILIFTLIISGVPIPSAYATSNTSYLDAIRAAMNDASSENPAGDWGTAVFKDGLEWGAFHYAVQNHIRAKDPSIGRKELPIYYENGCRGRADLYKNVGELTYLWEVKPLSYAFPPKLFLATAQLSGYVNSNRNYRYGNTDGMLNILLH